MCHRFSIAFLGLSISSVFADSEENLNIQFQSHRSSVYCNAKTEILSLGSLLGNSLCVSSDMTWDPLAYTDDLKTDQISNQLTIVSIIDGAKTRGQSVRLYGLSNEDVDLTTNSFLLHDELVNPISFKVYTKYDPKKLNQEKQTGIHPGGSIIDIRHTSSDLAQNIIYGIIPAHTVLQVGDYICNLILKSYAD